MLINDYLNNELQGQFRNWMNKSPLKWTYWFDPQTVNLARLTTHTLRKNQWIASENISIVDKKQPESSQLKNCTAAITQAALYIYPWMVVHCDTKYKAAFVCQDIKSPPPPPGTPVSNRTCDGDWFMIDGSNKCFSVFWPEVAVCFTEAQDICSAQNASIFNINVMYRNISKREGNQLKRHLLLFEMDSNDRYFLKSIHNINIYNSIFGKILASDSESSRLPFMTTEFLVIQREFKDLVFFANLNATCNVVEKTLVAFLFDSETFISEERRGWGVKCRSCSEPLNVTGIICEKDSQQYAIKCLNQHFQCNDGTCIVDIYRCDSVTDCFDDSDEDDCHIHVKKIVNHVYIPDLLNGIFQITAKHGIEIHSICDGIYSSKTLSREEHICFKYKLKQINLLSTTKNNLFRGKNTFTLKYHHIYELYAREKQLCLALPDHVMAHARHRQNLREDLTLNTTRRSRKVNKCSHLNDVCIVKEDTGCDTFSSACVHFRCPGLFKCHSSYCIYMSSVCDGQYDCEEGDDEIFCPLLSCPGLLKCRGENRCMSVEEICDNTVNCLHSMDDEIGCNICPTSCQCSGYTMVCQLEHSLDRILLNNGSYYIKGLILNGVQQRLFLNNIIMSRLVYLNASYCSIERILISNIKYSITSFIIIASFINNRLTEVNFIFASIFKNIVFLDLSFNRLSTFMYKESSVLGELLILILRGNPLKRISLNQAPRGSMLSLVDLQHINDYLNLQVIFSKDSINQIEVKVSDLLMCCTLDQNIKCTTNVEYAKTCIGLFGSVWSKVTFYSISAMTFCICLMVNIKNIIKILSPMVERRRKRYYWIASFNNSISEILTSLYLFALLVADGAKVTVLFWTLNPICLILKLICYIAIQTMVIFKTHSLFCVSLPIVHPFKHQNGYLKWTLQMCLVVWLIVSISSTSAFVEEQDEICSIVECSQKNTFSVLLLMVCAISTLTTLSCMFIVRHVYMALEAYEATWAKLHVEHRSSINSYSIILKLICPIMSQIPLHFCLLSLLVFKLVNLVIIEHFCRCVFLFVLPISLICYSLVSFYRN